MAKAEPQSDWQAIFDQEVIFRDKCWETCGGGYCCKPSRVQRHLSLLRTEGVELPLLPGEHRFLKDGGFLQSGFEDAMSRHEVKAREDVVFPVYRTVCNLDGLCSNHSYRPMVCRLYPWAPVPTADGKLAGLEPMAVIDQFWDLIEGASDPCTVGAMTDVEHQAFSKVSLELFSDPVNVFYLGAASIFKNAIRAGVKAAPPHLLSKGEGAFFSTWEKLLVFGQLYKPAKVLEDIATWHDEVAAHWGDAFSLRSL